MKDSKQKGQQQAPLPQKKAPKPVNDKQAKQEELEFLKKNLLKKLYLDLFSTNAELYRENALTFEKFIYEYYTDFDANLDMSNPDYQGLLETMDQIIKEDLYLKNGPIDKDINPLELKKVIMEKSKEDEWALIQKYQTALYQEDQKQIKKMKDEKEKNYLAALTNQIDIKSKVRNVIEEKKDEIYSFSINEHQKGLNADQKDNAARLTGLQNFYCNDEVMMGFLNQLDEDNKKITEDTRKTIRIKIDSIMNLNDVQKEDAQTYMELLVKIMKEKEFPVIKNMLKGHEYKKDLEMIIEDKVNKTYRPDRMNDEERKINKQLLEASRKYFEEIQKAA